jgi:hypothetical protein
MQAYVRTACKLTGEYNTQGLCNLTHRYRRAGQTSYGGAFPVVSEVVSGIGKMIGESYIGKVIVHVSIDCLTATLSKRHIELTEAA